MVNTLDPEDITSTDDECQDPRTSGRTREKIGTLWASLERRVQVMGSWYGRSPRSSVTHSVEYIWHVVVEERRVCGNHVKLDSRHRAALVREWEATLRRASSKGPVADGCNRISLEDCTKT